MLRQLLPVFCWPYQSQAELSQLLNQFHIGIGQLALDLKKLNSNSTIKNREYCARGIPFIYGHHDPDFEFVDFCLQVDQVSIIDIISWYLNLIKQEDFEVKMHIYAIDKLDFKVKMNHVKNIISKY